MSCSPRCLPQVMTLACLSKIAFLARLRPRSGISCPFRAADACNVLASAWFPAGFALVEALLTRELSCFRCFSQRTMQPCKRIDMRLRLRTQNEGYAS